MFFFFDRSDAPPLSPAPVSARSVLWQAGRPTRQVDVSTKAQRVEGRGSVFWMAALTLFPPFPFLPSLDSALMCQLLTDQFDTVADAVAFLQQDKLALLEFSVPGGSLSPTPVVAHPHWAISDAAGDSAIVEYTQQAQVGNASPATNATFLKV